MNIKNLVENFRSNEPEWFESLINTYSQVFSENVTSYLLLYTSFFYDHNHCDDPKKREFLKEKSFDINRCFSLLSSGIDIHESLDSFVNFMEYVNSKLTV